MPRYENRQELAEKIDWEGGIYEMLFGYGLSLDDLPEHDLELRGLFQPIAAALPIFKAMIANFEDAVMEDA